MRKKCLLLFIWIGSCAALAQTNPFLNDFNKFKNGIQSDYRKFLDEANRNYAKLLRGEWKEQSSEQPLQRPKDKEPVPVIADDDLSTKPVKSNPIVIEEAFSMPVIKEQPKPIIPIEEQKHDSEPTVTFQFFGTPMKVRFSSSQTATLATCSKESVANAWEQLTKCDYNNTLFDCLQLREKHRMNDWAYLMMLDSLSAACTKKGSHEATLTMSYLYQQSGYKMRLGIAERRLYLLFASNQLLYDWIYYNIGGTNYFVYGKKKDIRNLQMCDAAFPQEQELSLWMPQPLKLDYQPTQMRRLVSEKYPEMALEIQVNKNMVDFLSKYPSSAADGNEMTRWAILAKTPFEQEVSKPLLSAIKYIVNGLSEQEAVRKLLNWTQTAFVYKLDNEVWGYDRAFFPVETLFYPYCDCEDRSILLSRIIADVLGLESILVLYPGHLAIAVNFHEHTDGDYIEFEGRRFVVCDPTYIGAPIGMTMPGMDNEKAKAIVIK